MSYEAELEFKRERVAEALKRIGGIDFDVPAPVACPSPNGYRNKAVYQFTVRNRKTVSGFYRRRSHDVLPTARCLLQSEQADLTAAAVCELADRLRIPVYDERTHKGSLRRMMYRENSCGEAQLVIICADRKLLSRRSEAVNFILTRCPWVCGLFVCLNSKPTNTVLGGEILLLDGDPVLSETLCGYRFEVSPPAFLQVNREQAERLYDIAAEFAQPTGARVLDLYCGTGTLTLRYAGEAAEVVGAEIVPEAVENAKMNATRNGVKNATFLCGDAADLAMRFAPGHFDIVSVDPPRRGLDPAAAQAVIDLAPKKIVYVSCDPATLARDLRLFTDAGYAADRVQPVDMFPRTEHVECVVGLTKLNVK